MINNKIAFKTDKDEIVIIDYRDIDICCLSSLTKTINIRINDKEYNYYVADAYNNIEKILNDIVCDRVKEEPLNANSRIVFNSDDLKVVLVDPNAADIIVLDNTDNTITIVLYGEKFVYNISKNYSKILDYFIHENKFENLI